MNTAVLTEAIRRAGIDPEQVERELQEQHEAEARAREAAARERKILNAQRRREILTQIGRDAIDAGRVSVSIDGKPAKNQKAVCCPHCSAVPAELAKLIEDCGEFISCESRYRISPLQALNYPTADKRWVAAPAIRTPVSCKCGGEFTVSLGVIPA